MEAIELRIGNAYRDCTFEEVRFITSFSEDGVYFKDGFDWYESMLDVPLTEEWLLKFGFVKHGNENRYDISKHNLVYFPDVFEVAHKLNLNSWRVPQIKHVHQLQNLYFALTQKELITKP